MVDLGLGQEHKNIRPFKQTVNTWWAISLGQTQSLWAQQCAWSRGYWQSFICINKQESHFCSHEGKQEQGGRVNPPEGNTHTLFMRHTRLGGPGLFCGLCVWCVALQKAVSVEFFPHDTVLTCLIPSFVSSKWISQNTTISKQTSTNLPWCTYSTVCIRQSDPNYCYLSSPAC